MRDVGDKVTAHTFQLTQFGQILDGNSKVRVPLCYRSMVTLTTNEIYLTYLSSVPFVRCQAMAMETLELALMFQHNWFAFSDMPSPRQTRQPARQPADADVPIYNYQYNCHRGKRQVVCGPQFQNRSFCKGAARARYRYRHPFRAVPG